MGFGWAKQQVPSPWGENQFKPRPRFVVLIQALLASHQDKLHCLKRPLCVKPLGQWSPCVKLSTPRIGTIYKEAILAVHRSGQERLSTR